MMRPVHIFGGEFSAACGVSLSRAYSSNDPRDVTCKRCLKLIAAPQPSAPSTDRASAVKPVERRATVAGMTPELSMTAHDMLQERADMYLHLKERHDRLESLLREAVESADALDNEVELSRPETGGQSKSSAGVVRALTRYMDAREAACGFLGIQFESWRNK